MMPWYRVYQVLPDGTIHKERVSAENRGELRGRYSCRQYVLIEDECSHDWKFLGSGHTDKFYQCDICGEEKIEP